MIQGKEQNISPIKYRILYYIECLNISKREFYHKTGISRGTLESNTGITEETMAKFIATYPEVSLDWLILGEGEVVRQVNTPMRDEELVEMSKKLLNAKDEIIDLQKDHIHSLMDRIRLITKYEIR